MGVNYKFDIISLTNATTNADLETLLNTGTQQIITVTADDGYYFDSPPYLTVRTEIGSTSKGTFTTDEVGDYPTSFYLVMNDDFADSHYMYASSVTGYCATKLYGTAVRIPKTDKYGIISMYNPTPQQLKDIGDVRYYSGEGEVIDLGNYISSLIKVFVKIPQTDTSEVLLGGYSTGVECNVIDDDVIETNCGTIAITGKYENAMDYENTTVEIYLPLIGFKTLDTEKVMNETLSLFYRTNVINGDSIACIYNTTGTLLYTFSCKASFEIPYRVNADSETRGSVDVNNGYLFGFTPFVTVRYNKAYNASTTIANDDRETTLETLQGFVKCSEVFNTIRATTNEKEEIDRLLKDGVIIT